MSQRTTSFSLCWFSELREWAHGVVTQIPEDGTLTNADISERPTIRLSLQVLKTMWAWFLSCHNELIYYCWVEKQDWGDADKSMLGAGSRYESWWKATRSRKEGECPFLSSSLESSSRIPNSHGLIGSQMERQKSGFQTSSPGVIK